MRNKKQEFGEYEEDWTQQQIEKIEESREAILQAS
jgi:hypothetical protein